MNISIRSVAAAIIAASCSSLPVMAHSQASFEYPSKPIRILIPAPPGSPPDVVARLVIEPLGAALGMPVVLDNRPGASGTIAINAVAKADADGYTLGILTMTQTAATALVPTVSYDLGRDIAPVSQLTWTATILVVRSSSRFRSVADLVSFSKANPGRVTYASAGNGTPSHLASELFRRHAGIEIHHVPLKGISGGIAAILGEQVDMAFAGSAAATPLVKSGKLRALATAAPSRLRAFPDVPTIAELGFTGFEVREWHGLVAGAGTSRHIVEKLAKAVAVVIGSAEVQTRLESVGVHPAETLGPAPFASLIASEVQRWTRLLREAGIRPG